MQIQNATSYLQDKEVQKVNFETYTSRISSFNTFPTPEASISRLGRKVFSTGLREESQE